MNILKDIPEYFISLQKNLVFMQQRILTLYHNNGDLIPLRYYGHNTFSLVEYFIVQYKRTTVTIHSFIQFQYTHHI